jgi:mandelate racemase
VLTVREIRARALELRLERPVETAGGVLRTAPLVLVEVASEEGPAGRAYARCYSRVALEPLAQLVSNAGALLVGADADPARAQELLQREFRLLGPQGLTGIAMAAIDMALWDARARAEGVPLVVLLGGEPRPIPAYASLRTMSPAGAAAEAEEAVGRGFDAVKLKVGRGPLADDLESIRAVRASVGDGVRLMVDYNQCLTVEDAVERARALDVEGLHWIEEPTRGDDLAGHARIAAVADTPVQLGESLWGPEDIEKAIAARASDHLMLSAMKVGGVSGWLRAAALAEAAGLPVSSHTFPEFSAHLLAVTPTCHMLEYLDHAGPILEQPVRVVDGHVLPSDGPGAGVDWTV